MRKLFFVLILIACGSFAIAQDHLGKLSFPVTGKAEAKPHFLKGVLLLHSFEYPDALEAFEEAIRMDPNFAMAYWGAAMTHTHPIWMEQDAEAARAILNRLDSTPEGRAGKAATEREKSWLATLEVLYGEGSKEQRDFQFEKAMGSLARKYPNDMEASLFHALSILGTAHKGRDFRIYMRAAGILEQIYEKAPDHPGILHYMIHCYDDPVHANLGLRPARKYARIAPAAAHAQHMPSHIFLALGMWDDVVSSNNVSWKVADERVQRKKLDMQERGYHYLQWLEYGYLQQGRYAEARKTLSIMEEDAKKSDSRRIQSHLIRMKSGYVIETESWDGDAVAIVPDPAKVSDTSAMIDLFTNGYAAVQRKDLDSAKKNLSAMQERITKTPEANTESHHGMAPTPSLEQQAMEVLHNELTAAILFAEEKQDEAIQIMKKAVAVESSMTFEFGPPEIVKPSHELLGEMMLAMKNPQEAQTYFEHALERAPRRVLALRGLAAAASSAGNEQLAAKVRGELKEILKNADDLARKTAGM